MKPWPKLKPWTTWLSSASKISPLSGSTAYLSVVKNAILQPRYDKMKISLYVPNRHIQGYFYSATYHEPKIGLEHKQVLLVL